MAVGGMPQSVNAYVNKKTFQEIDKVKKEIINLFKKDFKKNDSSGRISTIYESIPSLLAHNKTSFSLLNILNKKTTTKDEKLLSDLIESRIVYACYNVSQPNISLSLTKNINEFKLYLSDIGLFTPLLFNDKKLVSENIYSKLLSDKLEANLGYLYENVMAQVIKS